jgi:ankyrin repeat protein
VNLSRELKMNTEFIPSGHPIFAACAEGKLDDLRRYLEDGLSVYSESEAEPPLIAIACGHGRKECVDLLVEFGLDINKPFNRFGQPPLQQAISYGHEDLVALRYLVWSSMVRGDWIGQA